MSNNSSVSWMVRALRAVGIGPKRPSFASGQIWRYQTRPGEKDSRIQILKIDIDTKFGEIVHIAVSGIRIQRPADDLTPISTLGHLPLSRQALEASGLVFEGEGAELPEFEEGYHLWRSAFDAGKAGVFTICVAEIVETMEAAISGGAA